MRVFLLTVLVACGIEEPISDTSVLGTPSPTAETSTRGVCDELLVMPAPVAEQADRDDGYVFQRQGGSSGATKRNTSPPPPEPEEEGPTGQVIYRHINLVATGDSLSDYLAYVNYMRVCGEESEVFISSVTQEESEQNYELYQIVEEDCYDDRYEVADSVRADAELSLCLLTATVAFPTLELCRSEQCEYDCFEDQLPTRNPHSIANQCLAKKAECEERQLVVCGEY